MPCPTRTDRFSENVTSSGLGVRLLVDVQEFLRREVRVFLSRRKALMAEKLLNGTEIRAPFEQVSGEGVPHAMW